MTPELSSFCTRFQQGVGDRPTARARSAMAMLAVSCNSTSILRSMASMASPHATRMSPGWKENRAKFREAEQARSCRAIRANATIGNASARDIERTRPHRAILHAADQHVHHGWIVE